jgi:flagellar assembly factor FliW
MLETGISGGPQTDVAEIWFPAGLPGFPDSHRFHLEQWGGGDSPFMLLTSLDEADVGFVVVAPWVFYPDYEFDLDRGTAERLGITDAADALVFCVVTLRDRPEDATVNLLGPIVVNRHNREAAQAVLPGGDYSVRAPLAGAR